MEDEAPRLRVQLRIPGVEEPAARIGPRPQDLAPPEEAFIESTGSLERSHELCLAYASREEIALRGSSSVLRRVGVAADRASGAAAGGTATEGVPDAGAERRTLAEALKGLLERHLLVDKGVAGLREVPGSPWISASAGAACGLGILRLFPEDARLVESGLRLADFALKGQVPWGSFYESFHAPSGRWHGVRGRNDLALLSVDQSARIADLLLALSEELARQGRPHEKYFLAGLRFVDFFLDEKGKLIPPGGLQPPAASFVQEGAEPSLDGMGIFLPMARVLRKTGRDRYKKALDTLVRRFSGLPWDPFEPPASREGRGSDSRGALLAARLFVQMRSLGYHPAESPASGSAAARARAAESTRLFASLLVPWIRVQDTGPAGSAGHAPALPGRGFLHDSFARQRLLCAGRETALLLRRLSVLASAEDARLLDALALDCLASARALPVGTAFIQHTTWEAPGKTSGGRGAGKSRPRSSGPWTPGALRQKCSPAFSSWRKRQTARSFLAIGIRLPGAEGLGRDLQHGRRLAALVLRLLHHRDRPIARACGRTRCAAISSTDRFFTRCCSRIASRVSYGGSESWSFWSGPQLGGGRLGRGWPPG